MSGVFLPRVGQCGVVVVAGAQHDSPKLSRDTQRVFQDFRGGVVADDRCHAFVCPLRPTEPFETPVFSGGAPYV